MFGQNIISHIYWSDWDTKDDKIKSNIAQILDYYLPLNNSDYPLYRIADLSDVAQALYNIDGLLGGSRISNSKWMEATEDALTYYLDDNADFGYVNRISDNRWILAQAPLRIYGTGRHWIYVYYNDRDFVQAKKMFEGIAGANIEYPCNVGKTNMDHPEERVYKERKADACPPTVALLLRVDDEINLEKVIHRMLMHRGKHIKERADGETEWFRTTPEKVFEIYKHIMDIW